jgi:hypothetical protein
LRNVIATGVDPQKSALRIRQLQLDHPNLKQAELAKKLIDKAKNKASWSGAGSGAGATLSEALIALPDPTGISKVSGITGLVASVAGDITATSRAQVQMIYDLAQLHGVPYALDDTDEAWTILLASQGARGSEKEQDAPKQGAGPMMFESRAMEKMQGLLRQGFRRGSNDWIRRFILLELSKVLASRSVLLATPVINAAFGAGFNAIDTNRVGKWSLVRARVRKEVFRRVDDLLAVGGRDLADALIAVVLYAATPGDRLTANGAMLLRQCMKRAALTDEEQHRLETLLDRDDARLAIEERLGEIESQTIRDELMELAVLINAATTFNSNPEDHRVLRALGSALDVSYRPGRLGQWVVTLKRGETG